MAATLGDLRNRLLRKSLRYRRRNAVIQMAQSRAEKTAFQAGIDRPRKAPGNLVAHDKLFEGIGC